VLPILVPEGGAGSLRLVKKGSGVGKDGRSTTSRGRPLLTGGALFFTPWTSEASI
jgi:hypothetical protein